jgi:hypothetical protein
VELDPEDAAWLAKDAEDRRIHKAEEARHHAFAGKPGYTNLHDKADLERHIREDHGVEPSTAPSHWEQHYRLHYASGVSLVPFENWSTTHRHTTATPVAEPKEQS